MLSTELKFASDCLINWFNSKYKNENLQVSNNKKINYEIENPINWETDRCWICNFPLHINPTMPNALKEKMSYGDFIIEKKHKLLRNIFYETMTNLGCLFFQMRKKANFHLRVNFVIRLIE